MNKEWKANPSQSPISKRKKKKKKKKKKFKQAVILQVLYISKQNYLQGEQNPATISS